MKQIKPTFLEGKSPTLTSNIFHTCSGVSSVGLVLVNRERVLCLQSRLLTGTCLLGINFLGSTVVYRSPFSITTSKDHKGCILILAILETMFFEKRS